MSAKEGPHGKPVKAFLTAESGEKNTPQPDFAFSTVIPNHAATIQVDTGRRQQTMVGIGSSCTEASAFVLAHLAPDRRKHVMRQIFSTEGANFSLTRTHIGACDFTLRGRYSCADNRDDFALENFSIACHKDGFDPQSHPGICDPTFSLLQMLKEAQSIKNNQADPRLRIIASAWTAPAWMKDIDDWFIPGNAANNWQGTGGSLRPDCVAVYADYLVRFLEAYRAEGIDIWGLTPVNEPCGNNGQWESLHFTPESQRDFIRHHLGPKLRAAGKQEVNLLVYDQNRDQMDAWADTLFADPETAAYTDGLAVHWYSSTFKVYEDGFRRLRKKYPDKMIIHTEGCIDDLGKEAPPGIGDPERFKESGWFGNDAFWWNNNATDWAYSANWDGVDNADHPIYTPVHRYARDIIVGINNGLSGWIDWNIVLDKNGGPNHVGNFCGAPIMIDTASGHIHYTPIFHILSQFSRTIRPGDQALDVATHCAHHGADSLHSCATITGDRLVSVQILNTTKTVIPCRLQMDAWAGTFEIPANSVLTLHIPL